MKKPAYLKNASNPKFTVKDKATARFLWAKSSVDSSQRPMPKSTAVDTMIKDKKRQSHQP